jgi:hypothetical protein
MAKVGWLPQFGTWTVGSEMYVSRKKGGGWAMEG